MCLYDTLSYCLKNVEEKGLGMLHVDLHVHTIYSGDALITPKQLVDALHANSFLKTVAVTDHNTLEGYKFVSKLATVYDDVLVLPGVEAVTPRGELMIIGTEERPSMPSTPEQLIEFAEDRGAVTVVPHPYRAPSGLGDYVRRLKPTAIEVYNPASLDVQNRMALQLAKELGLPQVAVSDAHSINELGVACTKIDAGQNVEEILKAIKDGKVQPIINHPVR
jgi:predicted metal-dependent phosphoesterase TrpH